MTMKSSVLIAAPRSLDEMTRDEFDAKMTRALVQAENGEGIPADEFWASLRREVSNSCAG